MSCNATKKTSQSFERIKKRRQRCLCSVGALCLLIDMWRQRKIYRKMGKVQGRVGVGCVNKAGQDMSHRLNARDE